MGTLGAVGGAGTLGAPGTGGMAGAPGAGTGPGPGAAFAPHEGHWSAFGSTSAPHLGHFTGPASTVGGLKHIFGFSVLRWEPGDGSGLCRRRILAAARAFLPSSAYLRHLVPLLAIMEKPPGIVQIRILHRLRRYMTFEYTDCVSAYLQHAYNRSRPLDRESIPSNERRPAEDDPRKRGPEEPLPADAIRAMPRGPPKEPARGSAPEGPSHRANRRRPMPYGFPWSWCIPGMRVHRSRRRTRLRCNSHPRSRCRRR